MEKAFRELGDNFLSRTEHLHDDWTLLLHEYPLSTNLMALSHVWKSPRGSDYVIAAKGSPEAIADLCHLDEARRRELTATIESMARDGLRILGVAKSYFTITDLPGEQHAFPFQFLGLAGLSDPVRPGVAEAVKECHTAGIRVAMITGDYPGTAATSRDRSASGARTIHHRPGAGRNGRRRASRRIKTVNLFARVVPDKSSGS